MANQETNRAAALNNRHCALLNDETPVAYLSWRRERRWLSSCVQAHLNYIHVQFLFSILARRFRAYIGHICLGFPVISLPHPRGAWPILSGNGKWIFRQLHLSNLIRNSTWCCRLLQICSPRRETHTGCYYEFDSAPGAQYVVIIALNALSSNRSIISLDCLPRNAENRPRHLSL